MFASLPLPTPPKLGTKEPPDGVQRSKNSLWTSPTGSLGLLWTKELLHSLSCLEGLSLQLNSYLEGTSKLIALEGLTILDGLRGLEGHDRITDVVLI